MSYKVATQLNYNSYLSNCEQFVWTELAPGQFLRLGRITSGFSSFGKARGPCLSWILRHVLLSHGKCHMLYFISIEVALSSVDIVIISWLAYILFVWWCGCACSAANCVISFTADYYMTQQGDRTAISRFHNPYNMFCARALNKHWIPKLFF